MCELLAERRVDDGAGVGLVWVAAAAVGPTGVVVVVVVIFIFNRRTKRAFLPHILWWRSEKQEEK